jgi:hypothetical protein
VAAGDGDEVEGVVDSEPDADVVLLVLPYGPIAAVSIIAAAVMSLKLALCARGHATPYPLEPVTVELSKRAFI